MTQRVVNGQLVRIVGMSRSGNHAIINWITQQLTGRWCFLNCVEPKSNPFRTARPMDNGRVYDSNIPAFDLEAERAGWHSRKDHLLFSQEDCFLNPALGPASTAIQDAGIGSSLRRLDLLIVRDPYNLFASRRRAGYQVISDKTSIRVWKQHAKAFLGGLRGLGDALVPISYNRWVRNRAYRQKLAAAIGLRFTDAGLSRIAACGGGSSFDGLGFDGRADQMRLFERWHHYRDDRQFWQLFDADVKRLAACIFPDESADALARTADIPGNSDISTFP